jgi:sigma-54-interacting transcriptional regulator
MSGIVEADLSQLITFAPAFVDEWRTVSTLRHNVLLEGSEASTAAVLGFLEPFLRAPVVWKPARAPLTLPTGECGALVLQEVGMLSGEDQSRLVAWLDRSRHQTLVISTSADSMFQQVECGSFDAVLYYRLNVILLRVENLRSSRL